MCLTGIAGFLLIQPVQMPAVGEALVAGRIGGYGRMTMMMAGLGIPAFSAFGGVVVMMVARVRICRRRAGHCGQDGESADRAA